MNAAKRHEIFSRFRSANPHPTTELEYTTPFELLIAVLLSAQATDVSVNLATRKLFLVADTPAKMLALGEEKLIPFVFPTDNREAGVVEPTPTEPVEEINSVDVACATPASLPTIKLPFASALESGVKPSAFCLLLNIVQSVEDSSPSEDADALGIFNV